MHTCLGGFLVRVALQVHCTYGVLRGLGIGSVYVAGYLEEGGSQ